MKNTPSFPYNPCAMASHAIHPPLNITIRFLCKTLISNYMRIHHSIESYVELVSKTIGTYSRYFFEKNIFLHFYLSIKNAYLCRETMILTQNMIPSTTFKTFGKSLLENQAALNHEKFSTSLQKQIEFTTIEIKYDKDDRPYAQYAGLSESLQGFSKAAKFLANYKLYLDEEANEIYFIYRIYNQYKNGEPLESHGEVNLGEYLENGNPGNNPYVENELNLFKDLYDNFDPSKTMFIPIPDFEGGQLKQIIYPFYNIETVNQNERIKFLAKINR